MAYRRFVTYRLDVDPDMPGKTMKRPLDHRTGRMPPKDSGGAMSPDFQTDYATAAAAVAAGRGDGVGFVFCAEDGFVFLDIDKCLETTPAGSNWSMLALELLAVFAGAAVEISQSGRGLHIIGRARVVPPHACKNVPLGLELYHEKRFVALTGRDTLGDANFDLTDALASVGARYFPPNPFGEIADWTGEPCEGWGGPVDDAQLLRAAHAGARKSTAGAFGGGVTFTDLWTADEDKLAAKWPSDTGPFGASEADAALATHLAYWTGKNCERIRDLMYQSELARQKWDDRPEWLETTIMRACSVVSNVAQARPAVLPPGVTTAPPRAVQPQPGAAPDIAATVLNDTGDITYRTPGREFLAVADQITFFGGCVYVTDANKIWVPGSGDMLDKGRFDVVYAGHVMSVDDRNEKTTDSAWDAATRSRAFAIPRVDRTCFRPECPPGAVITEDGRSLVNTYIPVNTPRKVSDPGPFIRHLEKLLPVARDRVILLSYMASVIQNPGMKAQWWPVIQGVEGNGKTLLDRAMSFCVGSRYSHLVNPEAMAKTGNQFNSWVQGNLYVGFEEIYVQHRRDFLESFKATVTNERVPLEKKGVDQATGDNRVNGMMFTNHMDAVPVTTDTRRYCIFYTAQQSAADLYRDGMMGRYFPDLYDWLNGRGDYAELGPKHGFAIVNEYLATLAIADEDNPAVLCVRAPETSATNAALRQSLGRAEQEVVEAVSEGRPGFCAGWISSIALDKLFDQLKAPINRNKRPEMMRLLGYEQHPGLTNGRVNNAVMPDNGKPVLYIRVGHLSASLTDPALIAKAYTSSQNPAPLSAAEIARFK